MQPLAESVLTRRAAVSDGVTEKPRFALTSLRTPAPIPAVTPSLPGSLLKWLAIFPPDFPGFTKCTSIKSINLQNNPAIKST
ncbi:hypothetical protein [Tabrizicola sp.]|uniref:hypothetical protein n=1 Tax=Tabrizicola sp. TaxID=2005166 RepID=UPI002736620A|nr:hypothetical protein [Tabrizicola sp.]MDP3647615.1 hypothetical protein [Paracoccaceae bacterium]